MRCNQYDTYRKDFIYNRSSNMNYFIYTLHHFTPHGKIWTQYTLTSLPMCGFIAQLVKDWDHGYFVHPSIDISVDISTDTRSMYRSTYRLILDRYVGLHNYRPTLGRYNDWDTSVDISTDVSTEISGESRSTSQPTINRYLIWNSGRRSANTLTIDWRQNIGRPSVVYQSKA